MRSFEHACPGVSYPTLERALADLQREKRIRCLGKKELKVSGVRYFFQGEVGVIREGTPEAVVQGEFLALGPPVWNAGGTLACEYADFA